MEFALALMASADHHAKKLVQDSQEVALICASLHLERELALELRKLPSSSLSQHHMLADVTPGLFHLTANSFNKIYYSGSIS